MHRLLNRKFFTWPVIGVAIAMFLSLIFVACFRYPETGFRIGQSSFLPATFRIGAVLSLIVLLFGLRERRAKLSRRGIALFITLGLLCQLVFLLTFSRSVYSDTGYVMTMVGRLLDGQHHWYQYFYFYPNNVNVTLFWAMCLAPFKWLGVTKFFFLVRLLQLLFLDLALLYFGTSFNKVKQNAGWLVVILSLFYLPLLTYIVFPYNDLIAVATIFAVLGSFIRLSLAKTRKGQTGQLVVMMLLMAAGIVVRKNSVIILIALLLTLLFVSKISRKMKALAVVLGLSLTLLGTVGMKSVQHQVGYVSQPSLVTPSIRYVNMSWNPQTSGEINGPDSGMYGDLPKDERAKKITAEFKQRLKTLGVKGIAKHLLKKETFQFALAYSNQDMAKMQVTGLVKHEWQVPSLLGYLGNLFQPVYILMVVAALYVNWLLLRKKKVLSELMTALVLFADLSILGVFTFHVFLWEVRDRYALPAVPFLLMLAVIAWLAFKEQKSADQPRKQVVLPGLATVSLLCLLLGFGTGFRQFTATETKIGNVYASGFDFYTEDGRQEATVQPGHHYQTSSFKLKDTATNFAFTLGDVTEAEAKDLSLTLTNLATNQVYSIQPKVGLNSLDETFAKGNYRLDLVNKGKQAIKTTFLQQLGTTNLQGPAVKDNGQKVIGLNFVYDFGTVNKADRVSPLAYASLFVLFLFPLAISCVFIKIKRK